MKGERRFEESHERGTEETSTSAIRPMVDAKGRRSQIQPIGRQMLGSREETISSGREKT